MINYNYNIVNSKGLNHVMFDLNYLKSMFEASPA